MTHRFARQAWILLFLVGLGLAALAYDNLVTLPALDPADPERGWAWLTADPGVISYVKVWFRTFGFWVLAVAVHVLLVATTGFRQGEKWAWLAMAYLPVHIGLHLAIWPWAAPILLIPLLMTLAALLLPFRAFFPRDGAVRNNDADHPAGGGRPPGSTVTETRRRDLVAENGVEIRPLAETDAVEWRRLRHALWPDESPDTLLAEMAAIRAEPARQPVFVAVDPAGDLCGLVEVALRRTAPGCQTDRIGYLEAWFVDPPWRGRGVGRRLVAAAEAWARSVGCREMASDTTPDYPISPAAHEALGFREVERYFYKALS